MLSCNTREFMGTKNLYLVHVLPRCSYRCFGSFCNILQIFMYNPVLMYPCWLFQTINVTNHLEVPSDRQRLERTWHGSGLRRVVFHRRGSHDFLVLPLALALPRLPRADFCFGLSTLPIIDPTGTKIIATCLCCPVLFIFFFFVRSFLLTWIQ